MYSQFMMHGQKNIKLCHSVSVTVSCVGRTGRTYTRDCIDTIDSPDDEHEVAGNM